MNGCIRERKLIVIGSGPTAIGALYQIFSLIDEGVLDKTTLKACVIVLSSMLYHALIFIFRNFNFFRKFIFLASK